MVINRIIVIYDLFLFCSVAVGLIAGGAGLLALGRWRSAKSPEARLDLEKYFYLTSSAVFIGALLRLVMLPLWFLILQRLIPVIPGAMCLGGIHQNVPVYSWLASGMKLVLPLLYVSWIIITVVDRKLLSQPFLRFRHILLLPLILLLFVEAFLDLKCLLSFQPTSVPCCTAMFDFNTGGVPQVFTESHWYFVAIACAALITQAVLLCLPMNKAISVLTLTTAFVLLLALPLALHTQLSPLILEAPFHHCIFCLLQTNLLTLVGSLSLLVGIYLGFTQGLIGLAGSSASLHSVLHPMLNRLKTGALAFYVVGFILLLIPTIQYI